MEGQKKQLTEAEIYLMGKGFLNAIAAVHRSLKTEEEKASFSKMVTNTVGDENLQDGVNEMAIDSSDIGGGPNCVWVRGVGWVCSG